MDNRIPDRDKIAQRQTERQESMRHYYDWNAHDLSLLTPGQPVRIEDQAAKKWLTGIVSCARPEPWSYEMKT